jgi:hypothetical protein
LGSDRRVGRSHARAELLRQTASSRGRVERLPSREKTLALVIGCGLWAQFLKRQFVAQQLHCGPRLGSIKHHLYFSPIVLGANKNLAIFFVFEKTKRFRAS